MPFKRVATTIEVVAVEVVTVEVVTVEAEMEEVDRVADTVIATVADDDTSPSVMQKQARRGYLTRALSLKGGFLTFVLDYTRKEISTFGETLSHAPRRFVTPSPVTLKLRPGRVDMTASLFSRRTR